MTTTATTTTTTATTPTPTTVAATTTIMMKPKSISPVKKSANVNDFSPFKILIGLVIASVRMVELLIKCHYVMNLIPSTLYLLVQAVIPKFDHLFLCNKLGLMKHKG